MEGDESYRKKCDQKYAASIDLLLFFWASKLTIRMCQQTHTDVFACVQHASNLLMLKTETNITYYILLYFHFAFCYSQIQTRNYTHTGCRCRNIRAFGISSSVHNERAHWPWRAAMVSGRRNDYISNWKINWLRLVLMMADLVCAKIEIYVFHTHFRSNVKMCEANKQVLPLFHVNCEATHKRARTHISSYLKILLEFIQK